MSDYIERFNKMKPDLVVIGSSLGGLQALSRVIGALPKDFPLPIVVVQHRGRDGDEGASRNLQSCTTLRVSEPDDKEALLPGRVYFAPSDYHLLVETGSLSLSTDEPLNGSRPSIDLLFLSAADSHGSGVIAVILTGANADGAMGARKIVEEGGFLIIQDPVGAEAKAMPEAAIAAVGADRARVLPLDRIAAELLALSTVKAGQGGRQ